MQLAPWCNSLATQKQKFAGNGTQMWRNASNNKTKFLQANLHFVGEFSHFPHAYKFVHHLRLVLCTFAQKVPVFLKQFHRVFSQKITKITHFIALLWIFMADYVTWQRVNFLTNKIRERALRSKPHCFVYFLVKLACANGFSWKMRCVQRHKFQYRRWVLLLHRMQYPEPHGDGNGVRCLRFDDGRWENQSSRCQAPSRWKGSKG